MRLALGSVAATTVRAATPEGVLEGARPTRETADAAAAALVLEVQPIDDVRSTADYRRAVSGRVLHRLIRGFFKKGATKASMPYAEAVDEALCYGWIDGITRRIDDELYTIRWTPRRPTSSWSAINIAKVADLKAAGRMHPAGLRAFEERDRRKDAPSAADRPVQELPAAMLRRFQADEAAWADWQARTPSFRRGATAWVLSAKRPETRDRRFEQLLAACAEGSTPAPFQVTLEQREQARRR